MSDLAERPFISLDTGFSRRRGVIVALSALLARRDLASFVRFCGENSLPIYLAFFLPMAVTRVLINKSGLITDAGTEAAIVTAVAVAGALADPSARDADALALPVRTPGCVPAEATTASRRAALRGQVPRLTPR